MCSLVHLVKMKENIHMCSTRTWIYLFIIQSPDSLTKIAIFLLVTHLYPLSLVLPPTFVAVDFRKRKRQMTTCHLNFYQICYERVAFLWVVLLQVCVIVLNYIMESLANTAVKVDGKGPPTTTPGHYTSSACYYTVAHKV